MNKSFESVIRVRMSSHDAHYGGNLVDGALILKLFGDAVTELLVRHDGVVEDAGLPVHPPLLPLLDPAAALHQHYCHRRAEVVE